jgi:hypothetical protein
MPPPVQLKEVIEAMEPFNDEWHAYINRETGEVVAFSDEQAMMAAGDEKDLPEWFAEFAPKVREAGSSEAYIELPGRYDLHEYSVMERFASERADVNQRERLLRAIQGRGAFGRFKRILEDEGIEDQWFACRDEAIKVLAAEFLEAEGIPYEPLSER